MLQIVDAVYSRLSRANRLQRENDDLRQTIITIDHTGSRREVGALFAFALAQIESEVDGDMLRFCGYQLPLELVRLTGGGPDTFAPIALAHFAHMQRLVGIDRDHSVLEIGCGIGRDAMILSQFLSERGSYIGFDIIPRSIDWCRSNITVQRPNFRFECFDVADQLHNPTGRRSSLDITFPAEDSSVDRAISFSVFTHMFEPAIRHYLCELARVLRPGGKAYMSWFIGDDAEFDSARRTHPVGAELRFDFPWADGCRIGLDWAPAGAVAYTPNLVSRMVTDAGLRIERIDRGSWSTELGGAQDVTVLTRD